MSTRESLAFIRDEYLESDACIQFSWVPTGQRKLINLGPDERVGVATHSYDDISHVQVYSLRNGRYGLKPGGSGWQFPPGPAPDGRVLVSAVVQIVGNVAYGTGFYDDGSMKLSTMTLLDVEPFDCGAE